MSSVIKDREIFVADLFCGAGGSSTGLARACEELGVEFKLTAVNHWDIAIASHTANHPEANHLCAEVDKLRSGALSPAGRLDILWASPSCTEHSYAKGGNNVDDQNRVSAWAIVREIERYQPSVIIIENVPPFRNWGPVERTNDGRIRPIKSRRGETFRAWFSAIESMGYTGKWDLLNAADYGEPQTRIRFFAIFTAPGIDVPMPRPTHGKPGTLEVERGLRKPWVGAREIIDWSLRGQSIFERDRPLSPNTIRRIEEGIRRYCAGPLAEAFLVVLRNHAAAQGLDDPAPTVTAGGMHIGLAEPTLQPFVIGQHGGSVARAVGEPLPTVTQDGAIRVCEPHIIDVRHGADDLRTQTLDDPASTITAKNGLGIVEPFIVPQPNDQDPKSVEEPLGSITTTSRGVRLVEPFLTSYYGDGDGGAHAPRHVDDPVPTVTTANRFGLVEPYLVAHFGEREGQAPRTRSVKDPAFTVTHRGAGDLVEPVAADVSESVNNIPGSFRGRVVVIDGKPYLLDVRFRMLQPHELSLAQGFPPGYKFAGTKSDQTAQIGNAVPVGVAKALIREALVGLGFGDRDDEAAA